MYDIQERIKKLSTTKNQNVIVKYKPQDKSWTAECDIQLGHGTTMEAALEQLIDKILTTAQNAKNTALTQIKKSEELLSLRMIPSNTEEITVE